MQFRHLAADVNLNAVLDKMLAMYGPAENARCDVGKTLLSAIVGCRRLVVRAADR